MSGPLMTVDRLAHGRPFTVPLPPAAHEDEPEWRYPWVRMGPGDDRPGRDRLPWWSTGTQPHAGARPSA